MTSLCIAIPTFNRRDCLKTLLDSILGQTTSDMEGRVRVVISDNASDDGTAEMIAGLGHPAVIHHRNDRNLGVDANVSLAHRRAEGDYVWFFGDDDLMLDGALAFALRRLEAGAPDFVFLNRQLRGPDLRSLAFENYLDLDQDLEYGDIGEFARDFGVITNLGFLSSAVVRASALDPEIMDRHAAHGGHFPHLGAFLEAFRGKPCRVVAQPLLAQRMNNQRHDGPGVTFSNSGYLGFLRMMLDLHRRGVFSLDFLCFLRERCNAMRLEGGGQEDTVSTMQWLLSGLIAAGVSGARLSVADADALVQAHNALTDAEARGRLAQAIPALVELEKARQGLDVLTARLAEI